MSYSRMILPAYDPACGRVFHADRRSAEARRVAMEVWYRANGREVAGHRLAVYRCKRCAGYHVAFRRVRPAAPTLFVSVPVFAEAECGESLIVASRVGAVG